jgi:hypothetical protein
VQQGRNQQQAGSGEWVSGWMDGVVQLCIKWVGLLAADGSVGQSMELMRGCLCT